MTETIFEKADEETCQIFQYQEVGLDINEFHHFAWKQSLEQFTSYIGIVSLDDDMPNMHAFIGSDTTGK
jgi:diadenosine tetraphosphatase ApaH/serine/threonine PP2A family protein phosphatase